MFYISKAFEANKHIMYNNLSLACHNIIPQTKQKVYLKLVYFPSLSSHDMKYSQTPVQQEYIQHEFQYNIPFYKCLFLCCQPQYNIQLNII